MNEGSETAHGPSLEFASGHFRTVGHLVANRSHIKAVRHRSENRSMAFFPRIAEPDEADAEFHDSLR